MGGHKPDRLDTGGSRRDVLGGTGCVILAERWRAIPTMEELHRPKPISLADRNGKGDG